MIAVRKLVPRKPDSFCPDDTSTTFSHLYRRFPITLPPETNLRLFFDGRETQIETSAPLQSLSSSAGDFYMTAHKMQVLGKNVRIKEKDVFWRLNLVNHTFNGLARIFRQKDSCFFPVRLRVLARDNIFPESEWNENMKLPAFYYAWDASSRISDAAALERALLRFGRLFYGRLKNYLEERKLDRRTTVLDLEFNFLLTSDCDPPGEKVVKFLPF